jgi:hypothetical protein
MARPTKKDKQKREQLLKYFKRDSEIYTNFEKVTDKQSKERMIYTFLDCCSVRNNCNTIDGICCTFNDNPNSNGFDIYEEEIQFIELMNIDKNIHDYYCSILANSKSILYNSYKKDYRVYQMIDEVILIKLFGKKRVEEFDNRGYPHYLLPLLKKLTDDEKEQLKNYIKTNPFGNRTIIRQEYINNFHFINDNTNLLIELDFTKPIKEIQDYIKYLYNEYQNNKISDVFQYLNIERNYPKLENHDIYKTNGHKPFNVVLADKLFIYDAKKNGLNYTDIQKEINDYSKKKRKFSNDEIYKKTIIEYSNFMINFIDKKEFIKFRKGLY